jgi:hypothetical protein
MCNLNRMSIFTIQFMIALVCFLSAAAHGQQVLKVPHGSQPMTDVDLPGFDITHFTLPDPPPPLYLDLRVSDCDRACSKNGGCVAWTYVRPNTIQGPLGTCWLKRDVSATKSSGCCDSGTVGEANTDRPGGDYAHFDKLGIPALLANPRLCESTCHDQAQCKAWSFVKPNTIQGPNGVCWLKNIVPPPVKNNAVTSGYFDYVKQPVIK